MTTKTKTTSALPARTAIVKLSMFPIEDPQKTISIPHQLIACVGILRGIYRLVVEAFTGRFFAMRARVAVFVAGLVLILASVPTVAHHSFAAEFDSSKPLKLTGTVTKIEWTNPHAWFHMDVKDDTGKATSWGFELGSPNGLMRAGWTRNSMKIGDTVSVEASRAKDGSNNANARAVTLASTGQRLFAASSQTATP